MPVWGWMFLGYFRGLIQMDTRNCFLPWTKDTCQKVKTVPMFLLFVEFFIKTLLITVNLIIVNLRWINRYILLKSSGPRLLLLFVLCLCFVLFCVVLHCCVVCCVFIVFCAVLCLCCIVWCGVFVLCVVLCCVVLCVVVCCVVLYCFGGFAAEVEPRASRRPGKYFTTKLCNQTFLKFLF